MKIGFSPSTQIPQETPAPRRAAGARETLAQDTVALSDISQSLTEMRHEIRTQGPYGPVRPELIAAIRQEMASGKFGGEDDLDRACNSLLKLL